MKLLRARLFHTPRDPFAHDDALEVLGDGALLIDAGRIREVGAYSALRRAHAEAEVLDYRDCVALPGLVDTHVHYPQVPVIGAMGLRLLEWLRERTLPEEERLADASYARAQARTFLRLLARNGTTTALVFGAHFAPAVDALFEEADTFGLRVAAGLVLGDRLLTGELHTTPVRAYRESAALAARWHGRGRMRYAVTPRFSLSCSEELLEVCGALLSERPDVLFTSHLNETVDEIRTVGDLFPWASDYLATYERYGLLTRRSVFAHDVHPRESELERLGAAGATVCHCPSSNMFIGSGLFPLAAHLRHRVRVSLGSDVGGGTGFSLFKEGLMAYQGQMLLAGGQPLTPARLLYLATRAGAEALGMGAQVGDFGVGKEADVVVLRPPGGSTLEAVLAHSPSVDATLAALFTLAREESVAAVLVGGEPLAIHPKTPER